MKMQGTASRFIKSTAKKLQRSISKKPLAFTDSSKMDHQGEF
jgi:hypothetical protein